MLATELNVMSQGITTDTADRASFILEEHVIIRHRQREAAVLGGQGRPDWDPEPGSEMSVCRVIQRPHGRN